MKDNRGNYLKISDFAEVITGGTPSTSKKEYWENGDIPWIASGECKNTFITEATEYITELGYKNSSAKMMPKSTVVIALTGTTTGKVGILGIDTCGNQSVTGILPNEKFVPMYLLYYLISIRDKVLNDSYGGAQKHISQKYVKEIEVLLPPLEIQKEIVEALDKARALIDARTEQLRLMDELIKSKFIEMFGDPVFNSHNYNKIPLGKIVRNFDSYRKPVNSSDRAKIQGIYPYYGATGIVDYINDYKLEGTYLLVSEDGKSLEFRNRDIAFFAEGKLWVNNHAHVLQSTEMSNLYYLRHYLNNTDISEYVTGIDQKKLNRENMDSIPIIMPPIDLQNQFAVFVQQTNKLEFEMQKSLDEINTTYQALMQEYFG